MKFIIRSLGEGPFNLPFYAQHLMGPNSLRMYVNMYVYRFCEIVFKKISTRNFLYGHLSCLLHNFGDISQSFNLNSSNLNTVQ